MLVDFFVLKILWLLASESLNLLRWEILTCCFLFCFCSQPWTWWLDLSLSKLLLAVALRTNSRFPGHADPASAATGAPAGAGHVDRGAGGGDAPPAGSLHPSCGPWPDGQQPTSAALHRGHQERGQGGWRIVHSGDGCYSGLYLCTEKSCCRSEGWKEEGGEWWTTSIFYLSNQRKPERWLRRLQRDEAEGIWAFLSTEMSFWTELNWTKRHWARVGRKEDAVTTGEQMNSSYNALHVLSPTWVTKMCCAFLVR